MEILYLQPPLCWKFGVNFSPIPDLHTIMSMHVWGVYMCPAECTHTCTSVGERAMHGVVPQASWDLFSLRWGLPLVRTNNGGWLTVGSRIHSSLCPQPWDYRFVSPPLAPLRGLWHWGLLLCTASKNFTCQPLGTAVYIEHQSVFCKTVGRQASCCGYI